MNTTAGNNTAFFIIPTIYLNTMLTINILTLLFDGFVIISMISRKTIKSYTFFLLFLIVLSEMVMVSAIAIFFMNMIWIKISMINMIFEESIQIIIKFAFFPSMLLSWHRFRLIKYPVDEKQDISIKRVHSSSNFIDFNNIDYNSNNLFSVLSTICLSGNI